MAKEKERSESIKDEDDIEVSSGSPLVFISHDSKDAEFAEAFSELLKSVSAGMLKSFRSSDKKGTEGIEYGDEWYKRLMSKLESASDVVCLFTERSLDRPWILYEAGVAKGKLNTPVYGIALGIPLRRVSTGPFYQFQNCGDSDDELTKLVLQLASRISELEPYPDVVRTQVGVFKTKVKKVLANLSTSKGETKDSTVDDTSVAKLFEEVKVMLRDLPSRIDDRLADGINLIRRRRRRFHPMMFEEMMHMSSKSDDPVGILMIASLLRDDIPWLYEIAMEVYRTAKSGDPKAAEEAMMRFRDAAKFTMRGPFMEEFGVSSKEMHMMMMELPHLLDNYMERFLARIKKEHPRTRRRISRKANISEST